jgi:murein DD-endopeptidase MepM/ murein hydrolase activator NlpD
LHRVAATLVLVVLATLIAAQPVLAEAMYKYRGENGEWIYADRPPDDGSLTEVLDVESTDDEGVLTVTYGFESRTVVLTAHNGFYAPVEMSLEIQQIRGMQYPHPDNELRWVLPARSDIQILTLPLLETGAEPFLEYGYRYLAGDPEARHRPPGPYRAPFAIATDHPVTQAFPLVATHTTPDSHYAVDLSMPIGTDIFAARDGVVFDVASTNFSGGLDPMRDGPNANVVRILHDDGTYAIYAHLNTSSIRVKPGDVVRRGQYIADSGNTGFSSGPHLHFAVVKNAGMRIESVPVTFLGQNSETVIPATGSALTAY